MNQFICDELGKDTDGTLIEGKMKGTYRLLEKALRCMDGPVDELEDQWSLKKANDAGAPISPSEPKQLPRMELSWLVARHAPGLTWYMRL